MTDRGGTLAAETAEFARPRAGDDGVGFLGLAVFEDASALEHEAATVRRARLPRRPALGALPAFRA